MKKRKNEMNNLAITLLRIADTLDEKGMHRHADKLLRISQRLAYLPPLTPIPSKDFLDTTKVQHHAPAEVYPEIKLNESPDASYQQGIRQKYNKIPTKDKYWGAVNTAIYGDKPEYG